MTSIFYFVNSYASVQYPLQYYFPNDAKNFGPYRSADKSLARPTSPCILFYGENISFDASLVIYINNTNIPPVMIINRVYEHQNILSLQLVSFLVRLRTYQHPCNSTLFDHHIDIYWAVKFMHLSFSKISSKLPVIPEVQIFSPTLCPETSLECPFTQINYKFSQPHKPANLTLLYTNILTRTL